MNLKNNNNGQKFTESLPINKAIRATTVLVIAEDGLNMGVQSLDAAIKLAQSRGLDLAQISVNKNGPPTCKLLNYDKYRFELAKSLKEKARQIRENEAKLKTVQLRPHIMSNDLAVKAKAVNEFLKDGCEVKIIVKFKGREKTHKDVGMEALNSLLFMLPQNVRIIQKITDEEKSISCTLSL